MAQIKLNFSRLSIPEKIARAQQIHAAMANNNPNFTNPQPGLALIVDATEDLQTAETEVQAARQLAKTKTDVRNQKEDVLDALIARLVGYVKAVADGNEAIIHSAGMDVRADSGPGTIPPPPQALSATAGDHDGEMDLSWDPVISAASYIVESSPDPPTATSWEQTGVLTKSTFTVTGLQPGSRRWFRVAAINPAGQSGWSDPATKIVP